MYFIGQTRFSIFSPDSKAWNISGLSEQEYLNILYSDERLSLRMKIFCNYSLPLLSKMKKDYSYKHIVSYSSQLPFKWKQILINSCKQYDFIYLHEVDLYSGNPIINILKDNNVNGSIAYFRLDDDDLLSINYLDQLSFYNNLSFKNMAISFTRGIVANFDTSFIDFRECYKQFLAIGQAYIGSYIDGRLDIPMNLSHHNLDRHIPVVLDSRQCTYLWTLHNRQDSIYRKNSVNVQEQLNAYAVIDDMISIEHYFPTLNEDLFNFFKKKNKFNLSEINLIDKKTFIPINIYAKNFDIKCIFKNINLSNISNGLVISFVFDDYVDNVNNLVKSPSKDIHLYRYASFSDGISKFNVNISLPKLNTLKGFNILLWDSSIINSSLESLSIIYD